MTLQMGGVAFDCENPVKLAAFWSAATDRPAEAMADEEVAMVGRAAPGGLPPMLFIRVPEGKTAKNRCHLDLHSADREASVTQLVELGAERVEDHEIAELGLRWTVLRDPEGNEFCVAQG
ncbi:glyoxalase [Pseudonocardia sulfidoxydans NBRC 16205]|uniref:Glyoxalase n=1 Tax=Pseudonocardia sulfidoxydans NBRC 16205 TaxID=1223511 RepID=A0A511DMC3_9PSEU|nr:VOC family protein [Pseudonocardia sulfidoxydans]GEL25966.1 glyoxalase [Pseudonocardia sulfidoxydans NBRC 16205]